MHCDFPSSTITSLPIKKWKNKTNHTEPTGAAERPCGGSVNTFSQMGQTSGPMADGETLKEDFRLKAWKEKVTPQKRSSRPPRQSSEGLKEAGPPTPERTALQAWELRQLPVAADGGSLLSYRVGEAPSDTDTEWQRQCALCRVTAHRVQHWQPAPRSLVSYPWDKNTIGSFSASQRIEGEKDICLSRPQARAGEVLRRAVTMLGPSPWGLKKGRADPGLQVLCTHFTVSTLPPLGTRLICLAQEGLDEEGRGREGSAGGKRRGQDTIGLL